MGVGWARLGWVMPGREAGGREAGINPRAQTMKPAQAG